MEDAMKTTHNEHGENCVCESGTCRNCDSCKGSRHCQCTHHKVVPGMISLIAIVFLLGAFGVVSSSMVAIIWPILLLVAGLTKMFSHKCTCC